MNLQTNHGNMPSTKCDNPNYLHVTTLFCNVANNNKQLSLAHETNQYTFECQTTNIHVSAKLHHDFFARIFLCKELFDDCKMTGNFSDEDSSDSENSFSTSKIKPKWDEAQKRSNFFEEDWPNTLQSGNSQPRPCIEDIIKLIRSQTRAKKNGQNGCEVSVPGISSRELARISSTIEKEDLQNIIGSVNKPHAPPQPFPQQQQLQQPPPLLAPAAALHPSNIVSLT